MPSRTAFSYTGLLNHLYYRKNDIDDLEVMQLLQKAEEIPLKLLPFKGIIHVIDYRQRRHVGISGPLKHMMGYYPKEISDNGLDFIIDIFQKNDFEIYNQKIFTKLITFLQNTPQQEHENYLFTFSYRMRKSDNSYVNVFQQGSYITDPKTNLPVYSIAMVSDVSPVKKDSSMVFCIDKKNGNAAGIFDYKNIETFYFYPDPGQGRITKREREILCWIAEGFSSKMIADRLMISENTVINHRKNMLRKTNTGNVVQLVVHAIKNGII